MRNRDFAVKKYLRQKAKDLMTNVKNDNAVLGDYVQSVIENRKIFGK
jgi:hypothetical protein